MTESTMGYDRARSIESESSHAPEQVALKRETGIYSSLEEAVDALEPNLRHEVELAMESPHDKEVVYDGQGNAHFLVKQTFEEQSPIQLIELQQLISEPYWEQAEPLFRQAIVAVLVYRGHPLTQCLIRNITTGRVVNMLERMPPGIRMRHHLDENGAAKLAEEYEIPALQEVRGSAYSSEYLEVKIGEERLTAAKAVATIAHEIGHAWHHHNNPDEYMQPGSADVRLLNEQVKSLKAVRERQAWAYALQEIRMLERLNVLEAGSAKEVQEWSVECLKTYEHYSSSIEGHHFTSELRALHRQLQQVKMQRQRLEVLLKSQAEQEVIVPLASGEVMRTITCGYMDESIRVVDVVDDQSDHLQNTTYFIDKDSLGVYDRAFGQGGVYLAATTLTQLAYYGARNSTQYDQAWTKAARAGSYLPALAEITAVLEAHARPLEDD